MAIFNKIKSLLFGEMDKKISLEINITPDVNLSRFSSASYWKNLNIPYQLALKVQELNQDIGFLKNPGKYMNIDFPLSSNKDYPISFNINQIENVTNKNSLIYYGAFFIDNQSFPFNIIQDLDSNKISLTLNDKESFFIDMDNQEITFIYQKIEVLKYSDIDKNTTLNDQGYLRALELLKANNKDNQQITHKETKTSKNQLHTQNQSVGKINQNDDDLLFMMMFPDLAPWMNPTSMQAWALWYMNNHSNNYSTPFTQEGMTVYMEKLDNGNHMAYITSKDGSHTQFECKINGSNVELTSDCASLQISADSVLYNNHEDGRTLNITGDNYKINTPITSLEMDEGFNFKNTEANYNGSIDAAINDMTSNIVNIDNSTTNTSSGNDISIESTSTENYSTDKSDFQSPLDSNSSMSSSY